MGLRLLDLEVFTTNLTDLTMNILYDFFGSDKHKSDTIVVYNNGFYGIIIYDTFKKNMQNNIEGCIQKEYLCLGENMWREAKEIFKFNKEIFCIPVLTPLNELIYFATNDSSMDICVEFLKDFINHPEWDFLDSYYIEGTLQKIEIEDFNEAAYLFFSICKQHKIPVQGIGEQWDIYEKYSNICFDNIKCPNETILKYQLNSQKNFNDLLKTMKRLIKINESKEILTLVKELKSKGIKSFTFNVPHHNAINNISADELTRKKYGVSGNYLTFPEDIVEIEQLKKVLGQDYEIFKEGLLEGLTPVRQGELTYLKDYNSEYVNVIEGKRVTTGVPLDHTNTIHIFGHCIVRGLHVKDEDTIPSILQGILNKNGHNNFKVINHGVGFSFYNGIIHKINELDIKQEDIILIIEEFVLEETFYNKDNIDWDLTHMFENKPESEQWYFEIPVHTNAVGNKHIAEFVYSKINSFINTSYEQKLLQFGKKMEEDLLSKGLRAYLDFLDGEKVMLKDGEKAGAIVMNCNPFTLGHKYLIEYAKDMVDILYIFVLEEDRSYFPFNDRIKLVREGTKEWDNVSVIPSGKYIISTLTLSEYFVKDQIQDTVIDATKDLKIFTSYIAPALNITVRFAGEEPIDRITKQYNEAMKEILPNRGIEFVEIKRKETGGNVISASRVRKCLENKDLESIEKLVPKPTYDYLIERFG